MLFVLPSSLLTRGQADEHFQPQREALEELGHEVRLLNLEALAEDSHEPISRWAAREEPTTAIYRGWMLTPQEYSRMEAHLASKGVSLLTSANAYGAAHELPGWYDTLKDFTPKTVELAELTIQATEVALQPFGGAAIWLRDYSKSLKHDRSASYIEAGATAEEALTVAKRFAEVKGSISGRILFREFEHFVGPEVRTWWVGGDLRMVTAHPDTPGLLPEAAVDSGVWIPPSLSRALASLHLPLITADFVQDFSGRWRLVEVGDGQVSDVPASQPLPHFFNQLFRSNP